MGVDEKIREVVLDRLERQRRYALVAGLIRKGLASGDSDLRSGMVSSLVYLEFYSAEDAIPIYREILEKGPIRDGCIDYDVKVRTKAVEKLEFLAEGSPDACVELNMIAMDDWNEDVRYAVNESIGNLGNKSPEHAMQLIRYAIENGKALKGVFTGMAHCPEGMIPLLEEYAATLDEKTGSKIQDSITRIRKREEAKKKEKANKETAPQEQGKSAADILRAYDPEHLKLLQELDFGSIVERWTRMLITEPWNHMKMGRAVDELARIDPSRFLELYLWATEPYRNPPEEGQIKREWEEENEKLERIITFAKHPELPAEVRGAFIESSEAQYNIKKGTLSQIYMSLGHLCESKKGEPIVPIRDACYAFMEAVVDSGYVDAMDADAVVGALKDIVRDESLNFSMMDAAVKTGRAGSLEEIFEIGLLKAEETFLRKLGSGAAGTTYLVNSPELDKELAMKIVEEGFYS
ncbi:hypothetical protein KY362_04450, partial [Candidatus Woesearchaeota archaeon]|nr:hypothetical protein [Candidatus Woesearchaeota archaeon]